jgi:hypothetical protein
MRQFLTVIFAGISIVCSGQRVVIVPFDSVPGHGFSPYKFDPSTHKFDTTGYPRYLQNYLVSSDSMRGMRRISRIDSVDHVVVSYGPQNWHPGAWSQGYYSFTYHSAFYPVDERGSNLKKVVKAFYNHVDKTHPSVHPPMDLNSQMIRGHLQAYLYTHVPGHLAAAKAGIDNLLDSEYKNGFTAWLTRASLNDGGDGTANVIHRFAGAHAMRALCEFYLADDTKYRSADILKVIREEAERFYAKGVVSKQNANYSGLDAWALASAYKVTGDEKYRDLAKKIALRLITLQVTDSTKRAYGSFNYDQQEPNTPCPYFHDQKISYTGICLRGLVETLDILRNRDSDRGKILTAVKRGVNHYTKYRTKIRLKDGNANDVPNLKFVASDTCGNAVSTYYIYPAGGSDSMEGIALLFYYSRDLKGFTAAERNNLGSLLNYILKNHLHYKNSLHFFPGMAYYVNYYQAGVTSRDVFAR